MENTWDVRIKKMHYKNLKQLKQSRTAANVLVQLDLYSYKEAEQQ